MCICFLKYKLHKRDREYGYKCRVCLTACDLFNKLTVSIAVNLACKSYIA